MRYLFLTLIVLFSLSGCNDDAQKASKQIAQIKQEAQTRQQALLAELKDKEVALKKAIEEIKIAKEETRAVKERLIAVEKAKDEALSESKKWQKMAKKQCAQKDRFSKTGIKIEGNTITIDTNKTKDFFETIGKNFDKKLKKVTQDLDKGVLKKKSAGVDIDNRHINIDLNKTKDFLENWGKKLQDIIQDFDTAN